MKVFMFLAVLLAFQKAGACPFTAEGRITDMSKVSKADENQKDQGNRAADRATSSNRSKF